MGISGNSMDKFGMRASMHAAESRGRGMIWLLLAVVVLIAVGVVLLVV